MLATAGTAVLGACGGAAGTATTTSRPAAALATTTTVAATTPAPAGATPASLVNPFMGTGVGGASVGAIDTFPGADLPFGMVQWSPDTSPDRSQGGGYTYGDSAISGFSLTHLSGPGCDGDGDIPVLPTVGAVGGNPEATTASFSHAHEAAHPGSYAVTLGHPAVGVQLTVTTRSGLGRFAFPAGGQDNLLFKVSDSEAGSTAADVTVVGDDEVRGSVTGGKFCDTSGPYRLWFVARFETPFRSFGTWHGTKVTPGRRSSTVPGSGGWVSFGAGARGVEMQVAISYVSAADAALNLSDEAPGWSLPALEAKDTATWNALLGRVAVSGGTLADEETFYSALYKSLLGPKVFDDDNGDYLGFDGKVHVASGYTQYTDISEWDIYRSEVPLLALLAPQTASDMVTSLLDDAAQGGALPKWAFANSDTNSMNGDSADPVIAAAYAFGAGDFDLAQAVADTVRGATDPKATDSQFTFPERQDLAEYESKGYVAAGTRDLTAYNYTVGGSETLEYAIDDFAVSQLAQAAGQGSVAATFLTRAQNWRNEVNTATGYIGARRADGTFPPGPAFQRSSQPDVGQVGFEEGNAIQYTWSVPQNLAGLFAALGGDNAVVGKLNTFFTRLNSSRKQPYDWAGNEPSLFAPWEYDYAGAPWRTQGVVRRIETQLYAATPDGEPGNDDLGAMASWYVWAALGLYPEVPGRGELVLGSPLFPHETVTLGDGRSIVLDAPAAGDADPYVRSVEVQGLTPGSTPCATGGAPAPVAYDCPWLPASATVTGATLELSVGPSPDPAWGSAAADAPPSFGG